MLRQLNPRQKDFIIYYIECGNAAHAVSKAGFTTKYPDKYASELLRKPQIKAGLELARAEHDKTHKLTIEYKLKLLMDGMDHYSKLKEYDKMARLIEVSNKMQGHNSADRLINTVSISSDNNVIKDLTEKYIKEAMKDAKT